jgi:glyoxylase-like metal-dependent hydrolase (beta-lactamase superfamily II)
MKRAVAIVLVLLLGVVSPALAAESPLRVEPLGDNVYAVIGPSGDRSAENLGNNANFGFVVTPGGVVLVDPGGSWKGAAMIEGLVREVTDQPVRIVVNTGGQDHRWLGNGYFKARGARILASAAAVADQQARTTEQFDRLAAQMGLAALEGTEAVHADEVFDQGVDFELGGVAFQVRHFGQAHTPGESVVWLPQQRVLFSGDIVYVGRMLSVRPYSDSRSWLAAFDAMAELQPSRIVPGHGPVTDLAGATADTRDYLAFLRDSVTALIEGGGDITQVGTVDQSRFAYLANFDELAGRNLQQVFQQMEWE